MAAELQDKELVYPPSTTDWANRLAFAHAVREKLRLEAAAKHQDYLDGRLTTEEWKAYNDEWLEREEAVNRVVPTLRTSPPPAVLVTVDLDRAIRDKAGGPVSGD